MREEFEEVLLLQTEYSSSNSAAMSRRGELVRHVLRDQLQNWLPALEAIASCRLEVEGGDGVGRKAEIPWIRVFSRQHSPRPTQGWYLVYLFGASGDQVYLSLNQGTKLPGGDAARPHPELRANVDWAWSALDLQPEYEWGRELALNARGGTGRGYEVGNLLAKPYELDRIPSEADIKADLEYSAGILRDVYRAVDSEWDERGPAGPDVLAMRDALSVVAGRPRKAWGPRLTAAERVAVERHAVAAALDYFRARGYEVEDVGSTESFDIRAERGSEILFVEVKGTTSRGASIVLTRNEVALHRECYPHNALCVIAGIQLRRGAQPSGVMQPLVTGSV